MIKVPGYNGIKLVHQGNASLVYEATRVRDGERVTLRQLRPEFITADAIAHYHNEFTVLSRLNSERIVKALDLITYNSGPVLVLERVPGVDLGKLIGHLSIEETTTVAGKLTNAISELHEQRIIHRNICPDNVIYDEESGCLTLIDFNLATIDTRLPGLQRSAQQLEGTLQYIAPEQTGRLNRGLDYRADFYALGATIYHLLTGRPPFVTTDAMELVHCHLALTPEAPTATNPAVPRPLSRIVMKLLSKVPEDRYQSAVTISRDLERCEQIMKEDAGNPDFEIALDDIAERINLPDTLIERDEAIAICERVTKSVAGGKSATIIFTGPAGVGKSTMIQHIQSEVLAQGGFVANGRYLPLETESPYSALTSAFSELVRQLLSHPDFPTYQARLNETLYDYRQPMVQMIPDLAIILDEHVAVELLSPSEVSNRLVQGTVKLLEAVTADKTTIAFCLDNLQWIDHASLELFEQLFDRLQSPYVMLVGSYRTEDTEQPAEIRAAITELVRQNPQIKIVGLDNLSESGINEMLSSALFRAKEETRELARLVELKTNGNPLAVSHFINTLNDRGDIFFDRTHREWQWNADDIRNLPPSQNVTSLLVNNLSELPADTLEILKIAACIGHTFDLELLQSVSGQSYSDTADALAAAISLGYVLYRQDVRTVGVRYQFADERVQQSTYSLLSINDKRNMHARIGQVLLDQKDDDEKVFEIVNHLNFSFASPEHGQFERNMVAQLNLRAGQKAKQQAAFQSSFKYFRTAIASFGQNIWAHYDLSLELHLEAAEAAYLCGDQVQLDRLVYTVAHHGRAPEDIALVQEVKLRQLVANDQLDQAIDYGHDILEKLKHPVSKRLTLFSTLPVVTILVRTLGRSPRREFAAQRMQGTQELATMRILMTLCQAGYISGHRAMPLYILKMIQMSIKHGTAPESSFAFTLFGAFLIGFFGTIESGYRYGQLALDELHQLDRNLHCKTITLTQNFVFSWRQHLKSTLEPLAQAARVGMETGDVEFSLIAAVTRSANAFVIGYDLNTLDGYFSQVNRDANRFNQTTSLNLGSIYQQTVRNLINETSSPWLLSGEIYDEQQSVAFHEEQGDDSSLANLYIVKMYLAFVFGKYAFAANYAGKARARLTAISSSPALPFFTIYESLALIKQLPTLSIHRQMAVRYRLHKNLRRLRKWGHHAPDNILHGYHLIRAELAAAENDTLTALEEFNKAAHFADAAGFQKETALVCELTGRFYLRIDRHELGIYYLNKAKLAYRRWGAENKILWLIQEFSELEADNHLALRSSRSSTIRASQATSNMSNVLDLQSVIKASQILSGEIVFEHLLERLMQVSIENAGAHRASLILNHGSDLVVEITTEAEGNRINHQITQRPLGEETELPLSVVQYVARTEEDLVLNNAQNEDIFTQDEYILESRPRSILCVPILSKARLTGILYLENRHATHAFNPERVAILKLLAAQSAIAIENARLYSQLNSSRNKYLSLYENALEGIFELNAEGHLTNINPAAAQLLGYDSPDEILSHPRETFADYFEDKQAVSRIEDEFFTTGKVIGFETELLRKDGSKVWVSLSAKVVYEDNQATHLEGSIVDVSERRLREEADQARIVAEAAAETKSQFLANMSHEIRTPMNAIIGFTDLALRENPPPDLQQYLTTIKNSSNHLVRVVNDILDISRVESGKLDLQQSRVSLAEIFNELRSMFLLSAKGKDVQLRLPDDSQDFGDQLYMGDQLRLGQVLINLVGNAIKFTQNGIITVTFTEQVLDNQRIRLDFGVEDSGIGIPHESHQIIFESFSQGPKTSEDGTGLGLSISKRLVEMMEGEIKLTSEPGQGSRFSFYIVVNPWDRDYIQNRKEDDIRPTAKSSGNVLLVEDNPINRELARLNLDKNGFDVTLATNGQEALDALHAGCFNVVLMDIRMPVMDGIEAVKRIRSDSTLKDTVVIAVSAGVLEDEVRTAMRAGFDHYLSKPINFQDLIALLRSVPDIDAAPAESYTESTPDQLKIQGVDFGQVLDNYFGDTVLLKKLTLDFIDVYENAATLLSEQLDQGHKQDAERLAHNVAGVAGSFSATSLMEAARAIEHLLIRDQAPKPEHLDSFKSELENFVSSIHMLHETLESPPARLEESSEIHNIEST